MQDAPSSGEDNPAASHPMVARRKSGVQATRRQPSRLINTLPRSYAESSSSELSERESPVEEAPTAIHSKVTRRKPCKKDTSSLGCRESAGNRGVMTRSNYQVQTTRRQSSKQNTRSGEEPFTLSHRMMNRDKRRVQMTLQKSSTIEKQTSRQHSAHPRKQVTLHREHIPTQSGSSPSRHDTFFQQGYFPQQGHFSQQRLNALQTHLYNPRQFHSPWQVSSGQQQFYASERGISAQPYFLPSQKNPVISDLSGIDPSILSLTFKGADTINPTLPFPFPPDPILLDTIKPIRIPIWEFRNFHPFDTFHEEPSDLALSDYEGGAVSHDEGEPDITTTLGRRPVEQGKVAKYPYSIAKPCKRHRELSKARKARKSTRSRKSISKHTPAKARSPKKVRSAIREHTPIENPKFNDIQTRFIVFMRAYWDMSNDEITEALNREFEGDSKDEPWAVDQVAKRLDAVKSDLKFEEYRIRWEDAREFRSMSRRAE